MSKEHKNSLVFFIILQVLVFYLLWRSGALALNWITGVLYLGLLILLIGFSRPLVTVFRGILAVTGAIGRVIFIVISSLVFYFILTPIALIMRLTGKRFVAHRFDPDLTSYYQEYQPDEDPEKQY